MRSSESLVRWRRLPMRWPSSWNSAANDEAVVGERLRRLGLLSEWMRRHRLEPADGTLVERTTRFTIPAHLDGKRTAEQVRDALIQAFLKLPPHLRKSLTWDQGIESVAVRVIHQANVQVIPQLALEVQF